MKTSQEEEPASAKALRWRLAGVFSKAEGGECGWDVERRWHEVESES